MAQLRQAYQQFQKRDTQIIVVGPESPDSFRAYWEKEKFPFIGIPDKKHTILKLYGQEIKLFKLGRQPAQMIIDKQGIVRYVHYGHSMSDIPGDQELFDLLDILQADYQTEQA